jgi:hypothetical protein
MPIELKFDFNDRSKKLYGGINLTFDKYSTMNYYTLPDSRGLRNGFVLPEQSRPQAESYRATSFTNRQPCRARSCHGFARPALIWPPNCAATRRYHHICFKI